MGTIIIIAVLVVLVLFAFRGSFAHFKGEGGCCGGDNDKISQQGKKQWKFYLNGIKIADKQKTAKTGGFYYVKELQEI